MCESLKEPYRTFLKALGVITKDRGVMYHHADNCASVRAPFMCAPASYICVHNLVCVIVPVCNHVRPRHRSARCDKLLTTCSNY